MSFKAFTAAAILAASSIATTTAHAQPITDSFTYQGTLNDAGAPANGLYDITFLVYDNQMGGAPLPDATITVNNVQVTDGLFTTEVNFGVMGQVFNSNFTRWMELRVSESGVPGTTILEPRQKLTPTTLANYALRAGFAQTSGTTLQDAYESGSGELVFNNTTGPLQLRSSPTQFAVVNLISAAGTNRVALEDAFNGGLLNLVGPNGRAFVRLERDLTPGGGGYMSIDSNDNGFNGIILEGNSSTNQSPRMVIRSMDRSIIFDLGVDDDQTVQLPPNAINATEILNEVGVAEIANTASISLTPGIANTDVLSPITIQAPSDGFVMIIASAEVSITHTTGTTSSVNVGVSDTITGLFGNSDLETRIPFAAPTGSYDHAVTAHAIFSASEGSNTYYFLGNLITDAPAFAAIFDQQVSAIFIPTAYGAANLQSNTLLGQNIPDEFAPISLPMTQLDILNEQNASLQADNTRQQRELNAMRQEVELIKQQLLENNNQPRD